MLHMNCRDLQPGRRCRFAVRRSRLSGKYLACAPRRSGRPILPSVEPVMGTRMERIRCWTRGRWAEQGVDLDKEWAREGVRVIE